MTSDVDVAPKKTTVGNYFVANYPPFSFWKPDYRADALAALERSPGADVPLGVYVHLPFCRHRCHFCYFRVYTGRDAGRDRVSAYLDGLDRELELYAEKPLLAGRKPSFVYFGGGTPSFLRPEQHRRLLEALQRTWPWEDVEEVAFECEPGTLNEEKLRNLKDLGVTRISLGVEAFSDDILKANGRGHLSKQTYRAYDAIRKIGFDQVNIDLIAGMLNETDENWAECIRKAIELDPDYVTVYQMEITFNSIIYKRMQQEGHVTAPVADWPTKRAWVGYAFDQFEKAGYTVTSGYTVAKNPKQYPFLYRDYLWRGADLVSLGVASFGHFDGVHYQNEHNMKPYLEHLTEGELPIYRALALSDEEKLRRQVILQLKLGQIERDYFRRAFGVDVVEHFSAPFGKLADDGDLTVDNGRVALTRRGLLHVDELLPALFLPEHQEARYT